MMRWWQQRQSRLWWKELRESYAVVVLGCIIILVFTYKMPASIASRYVWGIDFHMTATAILLFVAMVLGVTAYAVEEEYETLEPLMAKPIPPDDILATKLGVRLGLLFFSAVAIGIMELLTGAWPIKYGIPSPVIFERWVGGLMILICGLGLGFFFGKVLGRQITGLLGAILVFAAGWVLLELSPLAFLFEGESGKKIYWIKIILLPGLGGTIAIIASIRARPGTGGLLARPVVAAVALAGYALIFWSQTVVPPGSAWVSGRVYKAHWTARFGSPEAGLDALVEQFIRQNALEIKDDPDSISVTMVLKTIFYPSRSITRTERIGSSNLLGIRGRTVRTYLSRNRVYSSMTIEALAAERRSPRWISSCLDIARQPGHSEHYQLVALHLAGRADHPEHTEAIASYLDSPFLNVRLMAAYMLLARDDPRGGETIKILVRQIENEALIENIAYVTSSSGIDLGSKFGSLMRDWITREGQDNRQYRAAARFWYRKNGSLKDLDLIRHSLWLNVDERYRHMTTLEDMRVWEYLKDWNAPGLIDEYYRQARRAISELTDIYEEAHDVLDRDYWRRTNEERLKLHRFYMLTRSLNTIFSGLSEQLDPGVIELWEEYRPMSYGPYRYPSSPPYITYLPGMGEIGIQKLREFFDNTKSRIYTRFQAALILAYHGYREYDAIALNFYELYRDTDFLNYPWGAEPYSAFLAMVEKGNLRFAGPIIEEAWKVFENKGRILYRYRSGYRYTRVGTDRWNNVTAQILEEATGKKYGWNLKAWKKWWDEEGKALSTAGN